MLLVEALRGYAVAGQPALQKGIRDWVAAVRETYRRKPSTEAELSKLERSWDKLIATVKPIVEADALLTAAARLGFLALIAPKVLEKIL